MNGFRGGKQPPTRNSVMQVAADLARMRQDRDDYRALVTVLLLRYHNGADCITVEEIEHARTMPITITAHPDGSIHLNVNPPQAGTN